MDTMNGLDDTADEFLPKLPPEPAPRGIPHVPVITPEERAASARAEQAELDSFVNSPFIGAQGADAWYDLHAFPCPWMGGPYTPEGT